MGGIRALGSIPGIADIDSSNIMLSMAKTKFGSESLCAFCDPDEFLVTPSMKIEEAVRVGPINRMGACRIPRFNMTGSRDEAVSQQSRLTPFDALKFRIDKRARRQGIIDMEKDFLDPPWIFSAILGKVLVRLEATISIGDGDHGAQCKDGEPGSIREGVYLLHYSIRTWAEFEKKIEMAKIDWGINTDTPPNVGWETRRWMRLSHENKLY